MWSHALTLFQEFMGTGLIVIFFLISLVYLWLVEKRKHIRILFIYVPVILLLVFFNPLFAKIVYEVAGSEIYYRILWLIPITIVIAFAIVDMLGRLEGAKRGAFGVAAVAVIAVSGSYIYSNPFFSKAENLYHVPQSVADICDAIEVEGREVKAIFPVEMLQYVRQYSPVVCMPYGRDILVDEMTEYNDLWSGWNALYDVMEAKEIDAGLLTAGCRAEGVVYIVLPVEKKVNGSFTDYEFEEFAKIDDYVIYKDATVDLMAIFNQ